MTQIGQGECFAEMHLHDNAVATVINTVNKPHLVQGLFLSVFAEGFVFAAGSTGAITNSADNGGTLRLTDVAHGLSTGAVVSVTGLPTAANNNITRVTVIDVDTFDCDDIAFAGAGETGIWYEGDKFTTLQGSQGIYKISFHSFGTSAAVNKEFEYEVFVNNIPQENIEAARKYAASDLGTVGGGGLITLAAGDIITFAMFGLTDTTNFTQKHTNVTIHRIKR